MKKLKTLIAVLLVISLVACLFTACKGKGGKETTSVVQVTDESGEVVTDANGEVVTEIITVEDDDSDSVDVNVVDASSDNGKSNKKSDKKKNKKDKKDNNNDNGNGGQNGGEQDSGNVTKKAAPDQPGGFAVAKVGVDSIDLKWNGVKCDGYEIGYCKDNGEENWETLKDSTTATKLNVTGLTSYTGYVFRLRAFNQNEAGRSTSKWVTVKGKTAENKDYKRKITVVVKLPVDSAKKDELVIKIDGVRYDKIAVKLDKIGKVKKFTTPDEFKGLVKVSATLKEHDVSASVTTDKDKVVLDLTGYGIEIIDGGENL